MIGRYLPNDMHRRIRVEIGMPRLGRAFLEIMLCKLPQNILGILHEALWNVAQPRMRACDCT